MRTVNIILGAFNAILLFILFYCTSILLFGTEIWGHLEFSQLRYFIPLNATNIIRNEPGLVLKCLFTTFVFSTYLLLCLRKCRLKKQCFIPAPFVLIYFISVIIAFNCFASLSIEESTTLSLVMLIIYCLNLRRNYSAAGNFGIIVLLGILINNLFTINENHYIIEEISGYKLPDYKNNDSLLTKYELSADKMIAHGCGGIDGYVYTNSLEALKQSVKRGYKYIETDLLKTTDGSTFFAAHDYEKFTAMTGTDKFNPTDIKNSSILGKYTPLTDYDISDFFENNPHIWLVTDKVSDWNMLNAKLGKIKDRMIVEFWSDEQYQEAQQYGFTAMAYNLNYSEDIPLVPEKHYKFVTVSTEFLDNHKSEIEKLRWHFGTKVMVYTVNNKKDAVKYGYFADMIYYDGEDDIAKK